MAKSKRKFLIGAAFLASFGAGAQAADLNPIVIEAPEPLPIAHHGPASSGGWYIRGDVGYAWNDLDGVHFLQGTGTPFVAMRDFRTATLDDSWMIGGGVGYNIAKHLRADLTLDYITEADFTGSTTGYCTGANYNPLVDPNCTSSDAATRTALLLLANAYVDLGTYHGFTPYVGAGIGGAHVKWSNLANTLPTDSNEGRNGATIHPGNSDWRFAYSLMAGASYCVTDAVELDGSYRFTHIEGGDMFGLVSNGGPGYDKSTKMHQIRAGVRYNFGGHNHRCAPKVAYMPQPTFHQPAVYK